MSIIHQNFWLKPILNKGTHTVSISYIEIGIYTNSNGYFAIFIFENTKGYFPIKITISDSEQNIKYLNSLMEAISDFEEISSVRDFLTLKEQLVNKKLEIFIGEYSSIKFGTGLKINKFFKRNKK